MNSNITISIKDFCDAMRRSFEEERDMLADRKELELQAKASGINVSAAKKWLKAEVFDDGAQNPKRVAKLIEQTVDQVIYGESLGHDLGMFQNNEARPHVEVRNGSNQATKTPEATVKGEADGKLPRTASANAGSASNLHVSTTVEPGFNSNPATPSPPETGDDAASSSLASSPTNSPAALLSAGEGTHPTDDQERGDAVRGKGSPDGEVHMAVKSPHGAHESDDFDPVRDMPVHLRGRTWEKKEGQHG